MSIYSTRQPTKLHFSLTTKPTTALGGGISCIFGCDCLCKMANTGGGVTVGVEWSVLCHQKIIGSARRTFAGVSRWWCRSRRPISAAFNFLSSHSIGMCDPCKRSLVNTYVRLNTSFACFAVRASPRLTRCHQL